MSEQTDPTEIVKEEQMRILKEQIEFEEVTIKIPKKILSFITRMYGDAKEYLEFHAVDWVRADIECQTPKFLVEHFKLDDEFKAVLGESVLERL